MKKLTLLAFFMLLVVSCQKDDETVVAQCEIPVNLSVINITYNTVSLEWNETNNIDNASSYKIEYGLSGFIIGNGTSTTSTGNSVSINGLSPNSTYDFYVQNICSSGNTSLYSSVGTFTTLSSPVIPEFRQNLSELNLFQGDLSNLTSSIYAFEYDLNTRLFSDYAHKQRLIALPLGTTLESSGDGLPDFPENTVIAKTFYYNVDERDASLGRKIIETRILIKLNGDWESGDYKWNEAQTDATLDLAGSTVPISWIDTNGTTNNIAYEIPSNTDCFTCHQTNTSMTPIGPKLRSLNFDVNGFNQLQRLKDLGLLTGLSSPSDLNVLPNWEDSSATLEERARAYFDIQCAHCHKASGFCETQSTLRLNFETPFSESKIFERRNSISTRINTVNPGFSMPFIGTTIMHTEGVALIQEYLNSL